MIQGCAQRPLCHTLWVSDCMLALAQCPENDWDVPAAPAQIGNLQALAQFLSNASKSVSGTLADLLSPARMIIFGTLLTTLNKPMFAATGVVYASFGTVATLYWVTAGARTYSGMLRPAHVCSPARATPVTNHASTPQGHHSKGAGSWDASVLPCAPLCTVGRMVSRELTHTSLCTCRQGVRQDEQGRAGGARQGAHRRAGGRVWGPARGRLW